jgi:hypothetical protein
MRVLGVSLAALLWIASAATLVMGAREALASNARCQLVARYLGELGDRPRWAFDMGCIGGCPTSGACMFQEVAPPSDPPGRWDLAATCRCPSGTGGRGCAGVFAVSVWGHALEGQLVCVGDCDGGDECDWLQVAPPPGLRAGTYARCACQ